jgi:hypothetical protein
MLRTGFADLHLQAVDGSPDAAVVALSALLERFSKELAQAILALGA